MKRVVYPGKRFGNWTVLSIDGKRATVECDCGFTAVRYNSTLTSGQSTRCQQCSYKFVSQIKTNNYSEEWRRKRITYLIKNGVTNGREFNLTEDEVWILSQDYCYYCGIEPSNTHKTQHIVLKYNGIDRIDSKRGYTIDNVRPACWKCNSAKKEMSDEEFREWLDRIYAHWK